jgi:hypothetical protein
LVIPVTPTSRVRHGDLLHRRESDFYDARAEAEVPEDECRVEVIPAISTKTYASRLLFNGPKDRRWRLDRETGRMERVN